MNKTSKHQFAFYYSQLPKVGMSVRPAFTYPGLQAWQVTARRPDQSSVGTELKDTNGSLQVGSTITVTEPELVQRVVKILRLQAGDQIVLFDGVQVIDVTMSVLDKKQFVAHVNSSNLVNAITPEIFCIVPVLKRDALEDVIYAAVELGANAIQLVFTEKIQRVWAGPKEFARLHGIMIAACEQAKQFMVPVLHPPVPFDQIVPKLSGTLIFFDAEGQPAVDVITMVRAEKPSQVSLLIGPEADLTEVEKEMLRKKGVVFCKLTPTVLRARQAFAVGLGMFRSLIR